MRALFSAAFAASLASAQSNDVQAQYPDWATYMSYWQYSWDPIPFTTSDGQTLTIMHSKGSTAGIFGHQDTTGGNPVLVIPLIYSDPHRILYSNMVHQETDIQTPMTLALADQGFDVYYLFSRGSMYSTENANYDVSDAGFWDFTFQSQGEIDFAEAVEKVNALTGKKVSIISYSLSNSALLSGFAQDPNGTYSSKVDKVAMMIPCRVPTTGLAPFLNASLLANLRENEIFELGGPTWWQTIIKLRDAQGLGFVRTLINNWGISRIS